MWSRTGCGRFTGSFIRGVEWRVLSMPWKNLIRPGLIFIPFVLGALFPAVGEYAFLIRWLLMVMFYFVCLQIKLRQLRPQPCHWRLLAANLGVGVGAYWLLRALGFEQLALAAFFTGITPTANAAPVVMAFLHGRVGFVVSGFVITNLGVALGLVGLLPLVTGNHSFGFVLDILWTLLVVIGVPALAAWLTRKVHPAAEGWPGRCKTFSLVLWSCTLLIIAGEACTFLRENPDLSWWLILGIALSSGLICALNFRLGAALAPRKYRRECSQLLGQKNTTLTLFLALHFVNPLTALGPTFYVFCHNLWNAIQLFRYDRHRNRRVRLGSPAQARRSASPLEATRK